MTRRTRNRPRAEQPSLPKPVSPAIPAVPRWQTLCVCAGLVLLVLIPFLQVGGHQFIICDDNDYIFENPPVVQGVSAWGFWWAWDPHAGNWHPLTWLSHMVDWQAFQGWAGGHHLGSVAIHAASVVLLFLALRMMTGAFWPSAMVAALFAIHPLRAESVAWAAERKDVLSALFWMLTLLSYAWYARRPHILRYLVVLVTLGLGVMSKSMLVTLPCVLVLMDYWPLQRWRAVGDLPRSLQPGRLFPRKGFDLLFLEKIPMLAIVLSVAWGAMYSQERAGAMNSLLGLPMDCRVANATIAYVAYLGKIFWPTHLAIFYPHTAMLHHDKPEIMWWFFAKGIVAGAVLAAITGLVIWLGRRRPYLIVGWFWYLGTLVPVIGLVHVGIQSMADRYTYIPSIGISIIVVWGVCEVAARWKISVWALRIEAAAVLLACLVLTWIQVSYWENSKTLFLEAINAVDESYFGYLHLGKWYYQESGAEGQKAADASAHGRVTEEAKLQAEMIRLRELAREAFQESLKINHDYDFGNNNLGVCYADAREDAKAIACFEKAVKIKPAYADAHSNLCSILGRQAERTAHDGDEATATKRFAEAARHGELAIQIRADNRATDHILLGQAYAGLGKLAAADAQFRQAIACDPACLDAYSHLMTLCIGQGKFDDAIFWCQQLVNIAPRNAGGYCQLAKLYMNHPKGPNAAEAEKCLARALEIDSQFAPAQQLMQQLQALRHHQPR